MNRMLTALSLVSLFAAGPAFAKSISHKTTTTVARADKAEGTEAKPAEGTEAKPAKAKKPAKKPVKKAEEKKEAAPEAAPAK